MVTSIAAVILLRVILKSNKRTNMYSISLTGLLEAYNTQTLLVVSEAHLFCCVTCSEGLC